MNPVNLSEWLQLQGHRVIQTTTSNWVESGPRIYQAFPYHWIITPSSDELHSLFYEHGVLGLRYSTTWDSSKGAASYHVIYLDVSYSMDTLPKKARYDVQKGLKISRVEQIPFSRLAVDGWQGRFNTLERQGRGNAESRLDWEDLCRSADGLLGFEAWAATIDGQIAASLIAFTCDGCCSILYHQSMTKYLPLGVNNALAFVFTSEVLKRPGKQWVFYGLHSLDAPPSVDEFKFRMGYTAKPVRQRVVFHPLLAPLFNPLSHATLRVLKQLLPSNPSLAKAEGMVRFYLEGKKPLVKQTWPPPLLKNKSLLEIK